MTAMTDAANSVALFRGRPIVDMTRDELIEVVNLLACEVQEQSATHQRTLNMWENCSRARAR
jgi:hypothetical protein